MQDKNATRRFNSCGRAVLVILAVILGITDRVVCAGDRPPGWPTLQKTPWPKSDLNLTQIPFKIVYETFRTTQGKGNWELYLVNADGSGGINLTNT
ncbi:MAG: hypothetical protein HQ515_05950, partial [Phycisphaeraceae bacterium]|nr:hypothetical protein [Phycisphaeraceae bacterium]